MYSQSNKGRKQHGDCIALYDCVLAELTARRSGGSILPLFDRDIAEKITLRLTRRAHNAIPVIQF